MFFCAFRDIRKKFSEIFFRVQKSILRDREISCAVKNGCKALAVVQLTPVSFVTVYTEK